LDSCGFEIEPEITSKILSLGESIIEVPIHFTPRSYKEGKKIRPFDALKAIQTLVKVKFGLS
jgi:hypothetical protein